MTDEELVAQALASKNGNGDEALVSQALEQDPQIKHRSDARSVISDPVAMQYLDHDTRVLLHDIARSESPWGKVGQSLGGIASWVGNAVAHPMQAGRDLTTSVLQPATRTASAAIQNIGRLGQGAGEKPVSNLSEFVQGAGKEALNVGSGLADFNLEAPQVVTDLASGALKLISPPETAPQIDAATDYVHVPTGIAQQAKNEVVQAVGGNPESPESKAAEFAPWMLAPGGGERLAAPLIAKGIEGAIPAAGRVISGAAKVAKAVTPAAVAASELYAGGGSLSSILYSLAPLLAKYGGVEGVPLLGRVKRLILDAPFDVAATVGNTLAKAKDGNTILDSMSEGVGSEIARQTQRLEKMKAANPKAAQAAFETDSASGGLLNRTDELGGGPAKDIRILSDKIDRHDKILNLIDKYKATWRVLSNTAKTGINAAADTGVGAATMAGLSGVSAPEGMEKQASEQGFKTGLVLAAPTGLAMARSARLGIEGDALAKTGAALGKDNPFYAQHQAEMKALPKHAQRAINIASGYGDTPIIILQPEDLSRASEATGSKAISPETPGFSKNGVNYINANKLNYKTILHEVVHGSGLDSDPAFTSAAERMIDENPEEALKSLNKYRADLGKTLIPQQPGEKGFVLRGDNIPEGEVLPTGEVGANLSRAQAVKEIAASLGADMLSSMTPEEMRGRTLADATANWLERKFGSKELTRTEQYNYPATKEMRSTMQTALTGQADKTRIPEITSPTAPEVAPADYNAIRKEAEAAKRQELSGTNRKTKEAEIERAGIDAIAKRHAELIGPQSPSVTFRENRFGRESISGRVIHPEDAFHAMLLNEAKLSPEDTAKLQQLSDNMGQTVAIDYLHAPEEQSASGVTRGAEQAVSPAQARAQGEQATRRLTKSFVPTNITFNAPSKTFEVNGFSPDKLLNNASTLIPWAKSKGLEVWKDVNDPSFVTDFQNGMENYKNGYTLSGKPIEGTNITAVKPNPDYKPHKLSKDKVDLMVAMMGNEGTREGIKKASPEKLDKQQLARQNAPFWENPQSNEKGKLAGGESSIIRDRFNKDPEWIQKREEENIQRKAKGLKPIERNSEFLEQISETLRPELVDKIRNENVADENTLRQTGFKGDRRAFGEKGTPRSDFSASFMPGTSQELFHYTDSDKPRVSDRSRLIPNSISLTTSNDIGRAFGKNVFPGNLANDAKILTITPKEFYTYGKETDTPINRGKLIEQYARKKGYDAIHLKNLGGFKDEVAVLNQDKVSFGGKSSFMPATSDLGFYSKLEQVVEDKLPNRASAAQILATLQKNGVKPDEMKWTGTDDFLKANPNPTKEELLNHIRENNVQVKEVVKSWQPQFTEMPPELKKAGFSVSVGQEGGLVIKKGQRQILDAAEAGPYRDVMQNWLEKVIPELDSPKNQDNPNEPKFSQYTTPGGEERSYRELLLTLPERRFTGADELPEGWKVEPRKRGEYNFAVINDKGENFMMGATEQDAVEMALAHLGKSAKQNNFTSSHFDEPNVLAHVRFDTRTGENGEKILHLAELQSDWGQLKRKADMHNSSLIESKFDQILERMKKDGILEIIC